MSSENSMRDLLCHTYMFVTRTLSMEHSSTPMRLKLPVAIHHVLYIVIRGYISPEASEGTSEVSGTKVLSDSLWSNATPPTQHIDLGICASGRNFQ